MLQGSESNTHTSGGQSGAARIAHLLLLTLLVAGMMLPARAVYAQDAPPPVEPAAVNDTPIPVVTEPFEDYYLSAGLLYYSHYCIAGPTAAAVGEGETAADSPPAPPIQPAAVDAFTAYLKRLPVNGGFGATVATETGDAPTCYRYKLLTADADGVFYDVRTGNGFSEQPLRIEYRPGGASGAPVVVANTNAATYAIGQRMGSDATYIYWATPTGVVRARKDGTSPAPELVADGFSYPTDILVVGSTLHIADETGIFTIPTSGAGACPQPAGPCAESLFSSTGGASLVHRFNRGLTVLQNSNQIYWVAGAETSRRIHVRNCPILVIGPGSSCSESDAYTAPADGQNWYFGRPAFYNDVMFWHEAFYNPSTAAEQSFLRRLTLGGTPQTLATPISYPGHVFVDGTNVYYLEARYPNFAIKKLSVLAAPLAWDLRADKFEVNQGIQNTANGVPLIAKKTTFVRAYGSNALGPRANNVTARLYGTRGGSPLPGSPLNPTNGSLALFVGRTYDRARLNDGWLFSLPSSWTTSGAGAVTFRLVVDPAHTYTDPTPANNELSQALTFQPEAPACAIYVPVRTHNPKPSTSFPNFWDMVGRFQRLWPVPNMLNFTTGWQAEEVEVCWWGPFPHPCGGPFELNEGASISDWIPDKDEAIAQLWLFNVVNDAPACNSAGGYTHIMGMVHPSAPTGNVAGYASTISAESWVKLPPASPNPFPNTWNGMRQSAVMAQELAHNYGRKHVNCGSPGDIDSGYPYTPCQIANTGADSYYGFYSKTLTPISPTQARDFMAYGNNFWTSDYTWRAIITRNAAIAEAAQAASPDAGLIISADGTVLASGHLDTAKLLGQLNYVKVLPPGSMSSSMTQKLATVAVADYNADAAAAQVASPDHEGQPDATNFHLRLIGANNAVLADKAVSLVIIDDHDPNASAHVFVASFAAPAAPVVRVELLADTTVLDTLSPGVHAPAVTVLQPAAGATVQDSMTIAWNATDADNDPLVFTLQYSYDGGTTWQALTGDIGGTPNPANQLVLNDLSALHGSGANAARVRVIASDGFNTTIGTSAGFTLANRKPVPFVTNPNGQTYDPQSAVILQGGASDAEDGVLEGAALAWKVGATVVGSGSDAVLMGMAPGDYTATLEAKDAQNNLAAASAPFNVAPLGVPLGSAATLDGVCNDATYAAGAQVTLKPYGDAEQTQAAVRLIRDANYLYACFSGLKVGAATPGAFVGLRFDANNSREPLAQATDSGFFVGESGSFFTYAGNGAGDFSQPGPGGLQAQISADGNGTTWNAELRISKSVLGGWDHLVGMKAGHYWVGAQGDDYGWPYAAPTIALYNAPNTWARTALGLQPIIDAVAPFSMTVGSPTTIITVTGQYFDANAEVLWNNTPLQTVSNAVAVAQTPEEAAAAAEVQQAVAAGAVLPAEVTAPAEVLALSAATVLTASVPSAQLASAGTATIAVRNGGQITSTAVSLAINNSTPVITTLGPAQTMAEGPSFTLTVNGSGFANGAKVIWNGVELPTTFVSAAKVTAQVNAGLLLLGMDVGVTVRNPAPVAADSNVVQFSILHEAIFLPAVKK